ncbi:MAG: hypothetical protein Q7R66_00525 [Undibacterium sp.]|uniref:hypothetical protein n=1 Tax=Undibacterium sp. TaxID=1914977 RepID=UPI002719024C|nr:hypothetical protein [Undibacterium sp.]MDO8650662.1 hypothetical protein [Undibacterium sp.]
MTGFDPDLFEQIYCRILLGTHAICEVRQDKIGRAMVVLRGNKETLDVGQIYA